MRWISTLVLRLRSLFRPHRVEQDLADELRFHLDGLTDELTARGLSPDEARAAARRDLGGLDQIKEECRDARRTRYIDQTRQDVRYGLRGLIKAPGFTLLAILTLALGIGANTAIFSAVDAVLLRALPFPAADDLVLVWEDASVQGLPRNTPAPANYFDWQRQNTVFSDMAALRSRSANLTGEAEPEMVLGRAVTPNFFTVMGVAPALGRVFTPEEDRAKAKLVVLADTLWRRRFAADPAILGRVIQMSGEPYTVIGVMPASFCFPDRDSVFFWPISLGDQAGTRGSHFLTVVARLKPATGLERAQRDMDEIARRLQADYPATNAKIGAVVVPLREQIAGGSRSALLLLLTAAACVLLIACANLANLLLARATLRQREMAVRKALGAGKGRLVRQLVTEGALLAIAGGVAGVGLGKVATQLLTGLVPRGLPDASLTLDVRVLAFAAFATLGTVVLFAVVPALRSTRVDVNETLKQETRGGISGDGRRVRDTLVVIEVALALVLLVCAGLMVQTMRNMRAADVGFRTDHALTLRVLLATAKYPDQSRRAAFYEQTLERVRAVPGVRAAAFAGNLPFTSFGNTTGYRVVGMPDPPPGNSQDALYRPVTRDYFDTIGAVLKEGRAFTGDDRASSSRVTVVNDFLARAHWGDRSPIGQQLRFGGTNGPVYTIVGVVKDLRERGLEPSPKPAAYLLIEQQDAGLGAFLVVRTTQEPLSLAKAVTTAIWSIDRNQPVSLVRSLDAVIESTREERTLQMQLFGVFATLALVLASVGIYGVLSYLVSQRTREIGLRMALGAGRNAVVRTFVRQGLKPTAAGLVIGIGVSLVVGRQMRAMLFEVGPMDPAIYGAGIGVLALVASVACYLPARRASRQDPMVALREG